MSRSARHLGNALAAGAVAALAAAAVAGLAAVAGADPREPATATARAAKTVTLNETGHLLKTSRHNFTLNEEGSASGTAPGTIYVHLTTVSTSKVTAEVNIYPKGGSLTGYGTGHYRRGGTEIAFSGSMSIERGTGRYAGVHGSGLSFSGTIQESSRNPITVHVSGSVSS
jgi:hypothetical protein